MRTRLFTFIVLFIAVFINSFAQSGTSLKLNPIQFKETSNCPANNWLPIEIPNLYKKNTAFWKLTSEGFFVYSDGRFFYEDNYFQRMLDLYSFYGDYLKHSNINSLYNIFYAAFYPYRQYDNVYTNIMPVRNYSRYQKLNNTNTQLPVPVYFVAPLLNNIPAPLSVNIDEETRHKLKPVRLNEVYLIQVSPVEIRKANVYNYEKTKYDNSIERNIEWRKNNLNITNNNPFTKLNSVLLTKVTTSKTTTSSTTNKENIGSRGGNNSAKSTQAAKKNAE